jgi:hypothetical protein
MKTVFNKVEGIKMNASLDLGSCEHITDEFEYLMATTETMWDLDVAYFYRVTDDHYIQLAHNFDGSALELNAQFKLRFKTLKENIIFIVSEHIEAYLPYHGFPVLQKSEILTEQEFVSIIQTIKHEKRTQSEQAKKNQTPLIDYLGDQNLNPKPSGNNPYSWVANCPNGGNHFILIVTKTDTWGCGYCRQKGKLPELKAWIENIKIKKDQKRLSNRLKELKDDGKLSKETFE